MNIVPIEKEFFVLNIDEKNNNYRIYSEKLIKQWINELNSLSVRGFQIEFAVDMDEKSLKTEYVKETLFCGLVTGLHIVTSKEKKLLMAKSKFKIKGPYADRMREPEFFDNLTLVPKGKGKVSENIIYDYNLIGFNLIDKDVSPFILKPKL